MFLFYNCTSKSQNLNCCHSSFFSICSLLKTYTNFKFFKSSCFSGKISPDKSVIEQGYFSKGKMVEGSRTVRIPDCEVVTIGKFENEKLIQGTQTVLTPVVKVTSTGKFENGILIVGLQTVCNSDIEYMISEGKFENEILVEGVQTVPAGKFIGKFNNGLLNGLGSLVLVNGVEFIGTFNGGKLNGEGEIIFPDGRIVQGIFHDAQLVNLPAQFSIEEIPNFIPHSSPVA